MPDTHKLKKEWFILAHSSWKFQFIVSRLHGRVPWERGTQKRNSSWHSRQEAATVFFLPFVFYTGYKPTGWFHPHPRWVFALK